MDTIVATRNPQDEQHGHGDAGDQRVCDCECQVDEHSSDDLLDYTIPHSVLDPRRRAASHGLNGGGLWCASGGIQVAGVSGQDWPPDSAIDRLA